MNRPSQRNLALLVFLFATAADQLTKYLARYSLAGKDPARYLAGLLEFRYVENDGGFLGYLQIFPENVRYPLLTLGVALTLAAAGLFLYRTEMLTRGQRFAAILVLAGGTGNLLDRLLNSGGVIDFMIVGIRDFRSGIFNLADLWILSGAFFLGATIASRKNPGP